MAGADQTRAAGHRASVDVRLWALAPDPASRSDLAAWPQS